MDELNRSSLLRPSGSSFAFPALFCFWPASFPWVHTLLRLCLVMLEVLHRSLVGLCGASGFEGAKVTALAGFGVFCVNITGIRPTLFCGSLRPPNALGLFDLKPELPRSSEKSPKNGIG